MYIRTAQPRSIACAWRCEVGWREVGEAGSLMAQLQAQTFCKRINSLSVCYMYNHTVIVMLLFVPCVSTTIMFYSRQDQFTASKHKIDLMAELQDHMLLVPLGCTDGTQALFP
jgi:hypothetical protein